jgi:hypothetical protein
LLTVNKPKFKEWKKNSRTLISSRPVLTICQKSTVKRSWIPKSLRTGANLKSPTPNPWSTNFGRNSKKYSKKILRVILPRCVSLTPFWFWAKTWGKKVLRWHICVKK